MKLRLKGNSIRVRLDRRDLQTLLDEGRVEDALRFGPARAFSYAVELGPAPRERPTASYAADRLTIRIDPEDARAWRLGGRVGFDHAQAVDGGVVRVLLEKDFACLDRPPGQEADDAHAFPNPSTSC
ncbi:DUF7009 family protein [Paludisphaera mucosa]|uniref:Uncharacterized protein n=1 Tax=Paludisphaera mucosa TaxID=3030827 RepID=A0ABT6F9S3_9BACT|nr:hypothetical protein [Paludisphaera mucosa]MDG3004342.1 hypothetical protein [Paludisphaera mucosa]